MVGGLIVILVILVILTLVSKFLIKPKRYFCSECDIEISDEKAAGCPSCGASLT